MQSIVLYTENFDSVEIRHDYIRYFRFDDIRESISYDSNGRGYIEKHHIINDFNLKLKPSSKSLKFSYLSNKNDKRDLFDIIQNYYTNIDSVRIYYDNGDSKLFRLAWNTKDEYNNLYQKSFIVGNDLFISIKKDNN